MKRLIQLDPETYKPSGVICTFTLVGDKVEVSPESALEQPQIATLIAGSKKLTPANGAAYYKALGSLRGSYFFVEEVPDEVAAQ
jgi:hypothetical protein